MSTAKNESAILSLDTRAIIRFACIIYLQTAPLSEFVATATLVVFGVEDLAGSLVFELVVFAQESDAKRAFENATAVVPDASLTFDTNGVDQGTRAAMLRNALKWQS